VIASTQVNSPAGSSWAPTEIENFYGPESVTSSIVTAEDYPVYFACSLLTLPFSFCQGVNILPRQSVGLYEH
jgi:hypothetical protein